MKVNTGHLTYCTNIHAGKNWAADFEALKQHFPAIKRAVAPGQALGLGLRLSNEASLQLQHPDVLQSFKQWLELNDAYVFTMNGFPYGDFHHAIVKEHVHTPDWTTAERVAYTIRLFHILKSVLPEGMDGGISTSPLSYRHWFKTETDFNLAKKNATLNIIAVIRELVVICQETGQWLHLDVEPEPDGILETGREFIDWFENDLLPSGVPLLADAFQVSAEEAAEKVSFVFLRDAHATVCDTDVHEVAFPARREEDERREHEGRNERDLVEVLRKHRVDHSSQRKHDRAEQHCRDDDRQGAKENIDVHYRPPKSFLSPE